MTMPVDQSTLARVCGYRLRRVREEMVVRDIGSIVLVDPVNVRYATDTRNMQIFSARNPARYVFISADGPVVMFEFAGCEHLSTGGPNVDEVRPATTTSYGATAQRLPEAIHKWADEIGDLAHRHGNDRLGIERFNAQCGLALREMGFDIVDAQEPVERARAIKCDDELVPMQASAELTMQGVDRLRRSIRPGISENELWAELWRHVVAHGGDYIETRLLSSGSRTNPWLQEAGVKLEQQVRVVDNGVELMTDYPFDDDLLTSDV